MRSSESINEIATALAAAQGTIKPAPKDSTNPHYKNNYADLTSVWTACRDSLATNHLAVIQSPEFLDGRVVLVTRIIHKSGQWLESELSVKPQQDTAQGIGSCITYARRYALAAMVGVVADEDDDGNEASKSTGKPQIVQQAKPSKIFNAKVPEQVQWLESYLKTKGVSGDSYQYITGALHEKDLNTELAKIIAAVLESEQ